MKINELQHKSRKLIVVDKLLNDTDFDTFEDLDNLYSEYSEEPIYVTQKAWDKYMKMILPPEDKE